VSIGFLALAFALLTTAPISTRADEVVVGTITVTSGAAPANFLGGLACNPGYCGEFTIANLMSDTSINPQDYFNDIGHVTNLNTIGADATSGVFGWLDPGDPNPSESIDGTLGGNLFTVGGQLYQADPTDPTWALSWTGTFSGVLDIEVSADPVTSTVPEPGAMTLLSVGLLGIVAFGFIRQRSA
jgi:PEP-CTERM motif-containing protein